MVVTGVTALNPHPTIPFVKPLIRKSVNPLTIGAICATTIIPSIAYRPYRLYGRYRPYSPQSLSAPIALTGVMVVTDLTAPNPSAPTGVTGHTASNPHPTIPFVKPLIRKSVNPLTIGAICAIGATSIIPDIALRPYCRYCRYRPYSPYFPF